LEGQEEEAGGGANRDGEEKRGGSTVKKKGTRDRGKGQKRKRITHKKERGGARWVSTSKTKTTATGKKIPTEGPKGKEGMENIWNTSRGEEHRKSTGRKPAIPYGEEDWVGPGKNVKTKTKKKKTGGNGVTSMKSKGKK